MAKAKAADDGDDLIGGGNGETEDLVGGAAPVKKAKKASSKKAASKKTAAAPAAKKAPAKKKAADTAAAKSARGEGKFYFDPDEKAALMKKIATNRKPITTKDAAEKYEVETWQARLAMTALAAEEKGSMEKTGSVMTWNP